MRLALLVIGAACSSPIRPAPVPVPASPPSPAPPIEKPAPVDPLNLDFEIADRMLPRGWRIVAVGAHHAAVLDHDAHHGSSSLRLVSAPEALMTDIGASYVTVDATPYRGKHVRIHGWIKTADVDNYAGVWMRADDGLHGFDNRKARASWTTDWHEVISEVTLAPTATKLDFGVQLVGHGAALFDALSIEVVPVEAPKPVVASGHVVDAAGKPVGGAEVIMSGWGIEVRATADAAGAFRFETTAGMHSFSAHHAPSVGVLVEDLDLKTDTSDIKLELGDRDGVTVHGKVVTTEPIPSPSYAIVEGISPRHGDAWAVPIARDNTFTAIVPRTDNYNVRLDGALIGERMFAGGRNTIDVKVDAIVRRPAPAAVEDYVRDHAVPLATTEAGHGFDDMAPIGAMVGNAHVVGLGEATHGTREFFQMKHRILEYLVAEKGFTVFGIEAAEPECRAIDDYIRDGKGDAKSALSGLHFWIWNTEEVLAMIEWMRAWNIDPAHVHKLSFTGFDIQSTRIAYRTVADYLSKLGVDHPEPLLEPIKMLANWDAEDQFVKAKPDDKKAIATALAALGKHFDDRKAEYVKQTSADAFATARHDITVMQQFVRMDSAGDRPAERVVRDELMADNIEWIRAHYGPGTKVVAWAHNDHVWKNPAAMGAHLAKRLGADYVNIGFAFFEGGFQAEVGAEFVRENTLPAAPESDVSAPFAKVGKPLLALDLRKIPAGPVARWFAAKHPMRDVGAGFFDERNATSVVSLGKMFDNVIFVARTTRARPVKTY